jgi:hypothetical protein
MRDKYKRSLNIHPLTIISEQSWPIAQVSLLKYLLLSSNTLAFQMESLWSYASGSVLNYAKPSPINCNNILTLLLSSILFNNVFINSTLSFYHFSQAMPNLVKNIYVILGKIKPEKNALNPFDALLFKRCTEIMRQIVA